MKELEQQVIDGNEAENILRSTAFKKIDEFVSEWAISSMKEHCQDPEALQQVSYFLKAHDQYREWFQTVADSGKMAKIELSNLRD